MDLRFIELMQSAKLVVEELVKVKAGDEALIVTDTRIEEYYGTGELLTAVVAAIHAAGATPIIVSSPPLEREGDELPRLVGDMMKNAKIIFTITSEGILQAQASKDALNNGAKIMGLPYGNRVGKLEDLIYRLMPKSKAELEEIAELTIKVGERFRNGREVRVTTEKGTDITMKIEGLNNYVNSGYFHEPCVRLNWPGETQFVPTGQTCIGVTPGTANGRVVVDASIAPFRHPLKEPIHLTFEKGMLVDIQGGAEAQRYKELIKAENDPNAYNLAEIGTGTNPKAIITGSSWEDENYYGGGHIGIGSNYSFGGDIKCKWHSDAVFYNATIEIDGEMIMKNGEFLIE